jgi:N-acetylglutamate synthase-like GNAT family acetyltransferase
MEIIQVTKANIDKEHICCAIADKKGENCVKSKKGWLKQRFDDGLIFKKADVRGKVFIEYIPAEKAWYPIEADGYMMIDCFWVSGQYKGQGISNLLLAECINDSRSQGKKGIVALSSKKKMPYLNDGGYLKYKGFKLADTASPYYELLYLPFEENATKPVFKACAKEGKIEEKGLVICYSNQCPHTEKYVQIVKTVADEKGIKLSVYKYGNTIEAQNAPVPFTTYSFFYNGKFVTNQILSEKSFTKFINDNCL